MAGIAELRFVGDEAGRECSVGFYARIDCGDLAAVDRLGIYAFFSHEVGPGQERGGFAGGAGEVQAAGAGVAGVDAGGCFQFSRPEGVLLARQPAELIEGVLIGRKGGSREDSRTGPTGFAGHWTLVHDLDGGAVTGEIPGQGKTNDAAADDEYVVHGGGLLGRQETGEQNFVDAAAEAFFTVDFDDGDAEIVALAELGVGVDIDEARLLAVAAEESDGVVAEVTAFARVNNDVHEVAG